MNHFAWIAALMVGLGLTSCHTDLDINEIIDQEAPFVLGTETVNPKTGQTTYTTEQIEVNSEKWIKLVAFAKNHMQGWQSSPASHLGNVYLSQGNFKLVYTKGSDGVVVVFRDQEGKPRQYINNIEHGALDFLTQ